MTLCDISQTGSVRPDPPKKVSDMNKQTFFSKEWRIGHAASSDFLSFITVISFQHIHSFSSLHGSLVSDVVHLFLVYPYMDTLYRLLCLASLGMKSAPNYASTMMVSKTITYCCASFEWIFVSHWVYKFTSKFHWQSTYMLSVTSHKKVFCFPL